MRRARIQSINTQSPDRRGSTLIIVLALLGLLTLLGLVFFTFARSEHAAAEFFTEAAKDSPTEPDDAFEFGLRTMLIGGRTRARNNVLGSAQQSQIGSQRHTIVANLVGRDIRPGTGSGVNIIYQNNIPVVDQNGDGIGDFIDVDGDGIAESVNNLVEVVDSQVAHFGAVRNAAALPEPDVGYTYPDQNNMFLGYRGFAVREIAGAPRLVPVVIPSFMRPGLFRRAGTDPSVVTARNWHNDPGADGALGTPDDPYPARSMRPHRLHVYVSPDGSVPLDATGQPYRRFITDAEAASFGLASGWPFDVDRDGDGETGELGIFTKNSAELTADITVAEQYDLDVDTDGDGIFDGIWMDLDYPVQEDPITGRRFILMYSVFIEDMEALINLNAHGNLGGAIPLTDPLSADRSLPLTGPLGGGAGLSFLNPARAGTVSRSNTGLTPSEINPIYALLRAAPTGTDAFQQYERFFGRRPADAYELANMEWFWLLTGRGELDAPLPAASSDITDLIPGRFGEPNRVFQFLQDGLFSSLALAGSSTEDDNTNIFEGVTGPTFDTTGFARVETGLRGMSHPLDYQGSGRSVDADPRFPLTQATGQAITPRYAGYGLSNPAANGIPLSSNQRHLAGADGVLGTNDDAVFFPFAYPINPINHLFNDMMETTLEPERSQRPLDIPYGASDTAYLHMTASTIGAAGEGVSQRLGSVSTHVLNINSDVRNRFTTESWRLKNHSLSVPFPASLTNPFGPDGAPGWAGVDEDGDGFTDWINNDPNDGPDMDEVGTFLGPGDTDINGNPGIHTYSEDGFRAWEFNNDTILPGNNVQAGNGRYEFPPRYGRAPAFASRGLGTQIIEADGTISEDPFRPQLRRLLFLEAGDTRPEFGQLRLDLNRLLDVERLPQQAANLLRGTLLFRNLTEHPAAQETAALTTTAIDPTSVFPPSTIAGREFWAQRDRQKMARDIFVMLYTLGGGDDNKNYTSSNLTVMGTGPNLMSDPGRSYSRYTRQQLREMAQFAVNVVDALDRDNVITKFEYDLNLGDTIDASDPNAPLILRSGWNLDDNPDTVDGANSWNPSTEDAYFPTERIERGVVYGVERKSVAFSEVLGILATETQNDHPATLFDDSDASRAFLYMELQNLNNTELPLATPESVSDDTAIYRIRRFNSRSSTTVANHDRVALLRDVGEIEAGGQFVIAASDGTDLDIMGEPRPADFYLRSEDTSNTFLRIAPADDVQPLPTDNSLASNPELQPTADLDLVHMAHQNGQRYAINGNATATGADFMRVAPVPIPVGSFDPNERYVLVLERRQNPNMPSLANGNDWVEVDRTFVTFRTFEINDGEDTAAVQGQLNNLLSVERRQSLDAMTYTRPDGNGPNLSLTPGGTADPITGRRNTLGQHSGEVITLWQQHFDRDFHSLGELFNIPLTDPASLTSRFVDSMRAPNGPTSQFSNITGAWEPTAGSDLDLSIGSTLAILTPGHTWATNTAIGSFADGSGTFTTVTGQELAVVSGANARFLLPNFPDGASIVPEPDRDNRWYRLLGMWEIGTRTHRQLGNPLFVDRVPGPINPNTVRNPEVWMGVIDDPSVTDLQVDPVTLQTNLQSPLPDRFASGDVEHDWWHRLIDARDGSYEAGHTLRIPGLPGSRPFRGFGYMAGNELRSSPLFGTSDASLNSARPGTGGTQFSDGGTDFSATILRTLEVDANDADGDGVDDNTGRRMLEIGTPADHAAGGSPMTRNRLISKVMNNTNPMSHTFVMHMTVGAFEVVEVTSPQGQPVFRVGPAYDLNRDGDTNTDDHRRGVFVIDRSEFARAYDSGTRTFDWRRLIKHEVEIQ